MYPKLYSWSVKRAGGRMTILHSCGKVTGVDSIESGPKQFKDDGSGLVHMPIIATTHDGRKFELVVS